MKYNAKQSQDGAPRGLIIMLIVVIIMMIAMVITIVMLVVPAITALTDMNAVYTDSANTSTQNTEQLAKKDDEKPALTVDLATLIYSAELEQLLNEGGTGFLYVGRPTCPYCQAFVPLLNQALETSDNVFYFNIDANRALNATKMNELLGRLDVDGVPTFIRLENGVEIARLDNTSDQLALDEFLAQYR